MSSIKINSLRSSDACMRRSLVQIMACHLVGAKPLSEPMLGYYQLDPKEQTSVKSQSKFKHFQQKSVVCEMAAILSRPQ